MKQCTKIASYRGGVSFVRRDFSCSAIAVLKSEVRGLSFIAGETLPRCKPKRKSLDAPKITVNQDFLFGGRGWIRTIEAKTQQIYSLPPLATRELSHIQLKWSWWTDSNPRPADYKSAALPAELHQHASPGHSKTECLIIITKDLAKIKTLFKKTCRAAGKII